MPLGEGWGGSEDLGLVRVGGGGGGGEQRELSAPSFLQPCSSPAGATWLGQGWSRQSVRPCPFDPCFIIEILTLSVGKLGLREVPALPKVTQPPGGTFRV